MDEHMEFNGDEFTLDFFSDFGLFPTSPRNNSMMLSEDFLDDLLPQPHAINFNNMQIEPIDHTSTYQINDDELNYHQQSNEEETKQNEDQEETQEWNKIPLKNNNTNKKPNASKKIGARRKQVKTQTIKSTFHEKIKINQPTNNINQTAQSNDPFLEVRNIWKSSRQRSTSSASNPPVSNGSSISGLNQEWASLRISPNEYQQEYFDTRSKKRSRSEDYPASSFNFLQGTINHLNEHDIILTNSMLKNNQSRAGCPPIPNYKQSCNTRMMQQQMHGKSNNSIRTGFVV